MEFAYMLYNSITEKKIIHESQPSKKSITFYDPTLTMAEVTYNLDLASDPAMKC
jgi:hypothetical protein